MTVTDGSDIAEDPRAVLLFPSETSSPLNELKREEFDKLIVIDGTWRQAKAMLKKMPTIRHVRINSHETLFWRFQKYSRNYLATIEAIYWFYRDYQDAYSYEPYQGQFDNLLFYFKLNYDLIQQHYKVSGKAFTQRHALGSSYIESPAYSNKDDQ